MKARRIVSAVLLCFVAASVVYLVVSEALPRTGDDRSGSEDAATTTASAEPEPETGPAVAAEQTRDAKHKLIAYYFHHTKRCRTCLTIEAFAEQALREAFPDALKSSRLEWRVVVVDEPENEHFVEDYELTSNALVLIEMRDGAREDWHNLDKVWDLVENESEFKAYVKAEALAAMGNDS